MSISRWNPTSISSFFDDEFDFPVFSSTRNTSTGLNIYETDESVVAEMALPGVNEDKVDISIDGRVVNISAHIEEKKEEKDKKKYYLSSMSSKFNYSFRLPDSVIGDEPKAELADGVLKLLF